MHDRAAGSTGGTLRCIRVVEWWVVSTCLRHGAQQWLLYAEEAPPASAGHWVKAARVAAADSTAAVAVAFTPANTVPALCSDE